MKDGRITLHQGIDVRYELDVGDGAAVHEQTDVDAPIRDVGAHVGASPTLVKDAFVDGRAPRHLHPLFGQIRWNHDGHGCQRAVTKGGAAVGVCAGAGDSRNTSRNSLGLRSHCRRNHHHHHHRHILICSSSSSSSTSNQVDPIATSGAFAGPFDHRVWRSSCHAMPCHAITRRAYASYM